MKRSALALLTTLLFTSTGRAQTPAPAPANCNPSGGVRFVCGQSGPEDLVAVPDATWLIASAYGPEGGLYLIDTRASSSRRVFPEPGVQERLDRKTYDACPGPIPEGDRLHFRTHGLYL